MFKGIDLSYAQPTIDWDILKLQGIDFCYIKVAEGIHTVDSMCKNHAINAKKYSYLCGYYYFAHPARCNAKESADFFKSNLAALPPADMLFSLDIEVNGEQGYTPLSAADLEKWISDFINELGLPVIIYGGPGFLDANLPADHHLGQYPTLQPDQQRAGLAQRQDDPDAAAVRRNGSDRIAAEDGQRRPVGPLALKGQGGARTSGGSGWRI